MALSWLRERARSFRFILAVRFTLVMTGAVAAVAALSHYALRQGLDRELEASMLNVASIQAATVTGDPTGAMRFHEWQLTAEEATSVRDVIRYLQIWNTDGKSLVRSSFITQDLPLDTAALRVAGEGTLTWTEGTFQGIPIRALYYPLERMGELHTRHVLQVAAPLEGRNRTLLWVDLLLLTIVGTVALLTFAGAWWLGARAVKPVDTIVDQAEAIAEGSPRRSIQAFADTWEYRRLVNVLNRMLGRLEAALEAQKQFTADASHELRTPLTALRGELEVALRRKRTPEEYTRVLRSSLEEAERLSRLAGDLLTLTRSEAGAQVLQIREEDLVQRVAGTMERLQVQAREKGVSLEGPGGMAVPLEMDPDLMDQVIWNLLGNALKFTPGGGRVEVSVTLATNEARLEVADTGPGIPEEKLERVFHRFFRIDEARTAGSPEGGLGLGLAIVKAIVDLHGGTVSAFNRPSGGALFRVDLPVRQNMKKPS